MFHTKLLFHIKLSFQTKLLFYTKHLFHTKLLFYTKLLKLFKATLTILSIGLNSNIDGQTHYYERKSSDPKDGYAMVKEFLEKLFELAEKYQETLPPAIHRELESLQEQFIKLLKDLN